jgi:triphosphatase
LRVRYSLEFAASLFSPADLKRWVARLRTAQDVLGRYNDLAVAEQAFRALADHDPRAWFAAGWLAAQREALVAPATIALQAVGEAPKLRLKRKWR